MNDFEQKPKRKRGPRNPYLFLGAGIGIGIVVTALLGAAILLFAGNSTESVNMPSVMLIEPSKVPSVPHAIATAVPMNAQNIQPTPIANRIQAAAISGNGQYLAYVSVEEGVTHIYLNELRVERNLTGNRYDLYQASGYFNDIVFSPDGRKLIATIDSGFALLFDVETRTLLEEYPQIGGAAFTQDSNTLVLVGRNNGIRLLDLSATTPTLIASRDNEQTAYTVGAVAINSVNDLAVALDTHIEIYDLDNLDAAPQLIEPNNGFVSDLAFHPIQTNRLAIALAGDDATGGLVQIYDLNTSSRSQYDFGTRVFALAFSPDGEWLAVGGGESGYAESRLIAFRWDTSNQPIQADPSYYQPLQFVGHEHTIFDVAFTHEGYLLSAGWDGSVRLWELFASDSPISVYYP